MSRTLTIFLGLGFAAPVNAASLGIAPTSAIDVYLNKTSVDPDCKRNVKPDEIIVCGRREADKYRVPFIIRDEGDPKHEAAWDERERLQHELSPMDQRGPFLVGGGAVGISISSKIAGDKVKVRALAP